jgi:hypothetical protein
MRPFGPVAAAMPKVGLGRDATLDQELVLGRYASTELRAPPLPVPPIA